MASSGYYTLLLLHIIQLPVTREFDEMLQSSIAYIFCSFLSLTLLLPLIPSHWRAKNSGIILIIFWTFLGNIVQASSAIALLDATSVVDPGWCDFGKWKFINIKVVQFSICGE